MTRKKNTINLDEVRGTSATTEEGGQRDYPQGKYLSTELISPPFSGASSERASGTVICVLKLVGYGITILLFLGAIIWFSATLYSDVDNVKDGLKTVEKKTDKLVEASVRQEERINNIDNHLGRISSDIKDLSNKVYNK